MAAAALGASEQLGYGNWHNAAQDYSPKVDISYTKGKHAMKYGFSYNRYTKNQQLQADPQGGFSASRKTRPVSGGWWFLRRSLG